MTESKKGSEGEDISVDEMDPSSEPDRATTIANTIRARILAWQYAPGARLLEQDLCGELGVSRSLMRESLRMLEARGYLTKQPNRGYLVRQLDVRAANELYELREAIEGYVVEKLSDREGISEQTVASQVEQWRELWSTRKLPNNSSRSQFANTDRRFHESLAEALGNRTLLRELRDINDRIDIFRSIDFEQEHTIRSARNAHLEIVDAIASGDSKEAVRKLRENIRRAKGNIRQGMTEALGRVYFGGEDQSDNEERT